MQKHLKKIHARKQGGDFQEHCVPKWQVASYSSQQDPQKIAPQELDEVPKLQQSLSMPILRKKKHQPEENRRYLDEDVTRNLRVWG